MPTIHSVADSVTLADKRLLRAYPRIVKELTDAEDKLDRLELDGFLKLLPGAVERFESSNEINANAIEPSVLSAIQTITLSFGSRNAVAVETETVSGISNTPDQAVETVAGVSDSELPNGSDTDQSVASITLPHNELEAPAGSGGEVSHQQAGPRNPRVKRAPSSGRARYKQRLQELAETAGDQGRLSESEGGSKREWTAPADGGTMPRNAKG